MGDQQYILSHLAGIFHTGVFFLLLDQFVSYEENPQYNPLYSNESFRLMLPKCWKRMDCGGSSLLVRLG